MVIYVMIYPTFLVMMICTLDTLYNVIYNIINIYMCV